MNIAIYIDGIPRMTDRTRVHFYNLLTRFKDVNITYYLPSQNIHEIEADVILLILAAHQYFHMFQKIDFSSVFAPVILIDEDHICYNFDSQYNTKWKNSILSFYENCNANVVIRRHSFTEEFKFPTVWLPMSGDETTIEYDSDVNKSSIIGFAASFGNIPEYSIRRKAISILENTKYLDNKYAIKKLYSDYSKYLNSVTGLLACSISKAHTAIAKMFEAPLCKTALLTNRFNFNKELFGNKQCCYTYKDDCSNLLEVTKDLLNNHEKRCEITNNAYNRVIKYHTNNKRIIELYNILEAVINKNKIPRIWGQ